MSSKKIVVVSDLQQPEAWGWEKEGNEYRYTGMLPGRSLLERMLEEKPYALIFAGDIIPQLNHTPFQQPQLVAPFWLTLTGLLNDLKQENRPDVYVIPGSWETTLLEQPFTNLSNIIYLPRPALIPDEDFSFFFIPGSSSNPKSHIPFAYTLTEKALPQPQREVQLFPVQNGPYTGFIRAEAQLIPLPYLQTILKHAHEDESYPPTLENLVVVSHDPPRFTSPHAIDRATAAFKYEVAPIPSRLNVRRLIRALTREEYQKAKSGELDLPGWNLEEENQGVEAFTHLAKMYKPLAWLAGHIEESGGRAHTLDEQPVPENTPVGGLYMNVSPSFSQRDGEGPSHSYALLHLNPEAGRVSYELKRVQLDQDAKPLLPPPSRIPVVRYTLHP